MRLLRQCLLFFPASRQSTRPLSNGAAARFATSGFGQLRIVSDTLSPADAVAVLRVGSKRGK